MKRGGILLLMMVVAATARAASDNAADLAYSDGWQTGDNGGSGFGAWTLQTSTASPAANGLFIGSSNGNGFGNGPGIDSGGSAWGLYANNGQQFPGGASALRGFSLGIGQKLSIDMDNGFIDSGRTVALRLLVGGAIRFELQFVGGNSNYSVVDGGGTVDTGLPFTDGGLHVEFTLTGVDTYSVGITRLADSAVFAHSGTLDFAGSLDGIDGLQLVNGGAGSGGDHDLFFNNLAIVPEPSTVLLVGLGLLSVATLRRRS